MAYKCRRYLPALLCGAVLATTISVHFPQLLVRGPSGSASALEQSSPQQPRLTMCTMAQNDLPYLVEWIEFHMAVGFSYVFICDDGSEDNTTDIGDLYRTRNKSYVEIVPSPNLKAGIPGQHACYAACKEATSTFTDWWFVADSDEYLHSQNYGNIAQYMATVPLEVSQVVVNPVRFGVHDTEVGRFKNHLKLLNGSERLQYVGPSGSAAQLLTQQQVYRGASNACGEPEEAIRAAFPCCTKTSKNGWPLCDNGLGKSLARVSSTEKLILHQHETNGSTLTVSADNLRINHYYTRSEEDARLKAEKWNKPDPLDVFLESNMYWTAIEDRSMQRYRTDLVLRMADLSS